MFRNLRQGDDDEVEWIERPLAARRAVFFCAITISPNPNNKGWQRREDGVKRAALALSLPMRAASQRCQGPSVCFFEVFLRPFNIVRFGSDIKKPIRLHSGWVHTTNKVLVYISILVVYIMYRATRQGRVWAIVIWWLMYCVLHFHFGCQVFAGSTIVMVIRGVSPFHALTHDSYKHS